MADGDETPSQGSSRAAPVFGSLEADARDGVPAQDVVTTLFERHVIFGFDRARSCMIFDALSARPAGGPRRPRTRTG